MFDSIKERLVTKDLVLFEPSDNLTTLREHVYMEEAPKVVRLHPFAEDLVAVTNEMLEAGYEEFLSVEGTRDIRLICEAVYLAMEYERRAQSDERPRFNDYRAQVFAD